MEDTPKDVSNLAKKDEINSNTERKLILHNDNQFEVFISYRTNPDQGLAIALKELLEGAILPELRVFVASSGGLRPSNIGYKPQIQAAAQSAKAFIAIITQQSKEREWLFYEAGAAWGRNQLFAPLLIDTSPNELASVMADYQSVKASDRASMESLIYSIAEANKGTVKNYFSRRHQTFLKKVENYRKAEKIDQKENQETPLSQAIKLLENGEIEEASQLFDNLLCEARDTEERAKIEVARIIHRPQASSQQSESSRISKLEDLLPEFGDTCCLHFWLGLFEARPTLSIFHYEEALRISETNETDNLFKKYAIIQLAVEKFKLGEKDFALKTLLNAINSEDREFRALAAEAWVNLDHNPNVFETLVVMSAGLTDKPDSSLLLERICGIAIKNNWPTLIRLFSQLYDDVDSQGSAANNLGIAFSKLELHSNAYLAYSKAAAAGISVAKVNIAQLHLNQSIPAAGLTILQEHVGDFDAADAWYPYHVRTELERIVQQERQTAKQLFIEGEKLAHAIKYFACLAISEDSIVPIGGRVVIGTDTFLIKIDEINNITLSNDEKNKQMKLSLVSKCINLWCLLSSSDLTELFCFMKDMSMLKFSAALGDVEPNPSIEKFWIKDMKA